LIIVSGTPNDPVANKKFLTTSVTSVAWLRSARSLSGGKFIEGLRNPSFKTLRRTIIACIQRHLGVFAIAFGAMVAFLAARQSAYTPGAFFRLDGGSSRGSS